MATEFQHRLADPERAEPSELTHSGARPRLGESHPQDAVAERVSRVTRNSVRPSAFGLPRISRSSIAPPVRDGSYAMPPSAPPAVESALANASMAQPVPARAQPTPASHPVPAVSPPRVSGTVRKATGRAIKTDIEELLPLSQAVKSLPRPPRLPIFDSMPPPPPRARRIPWISVTMLGTVLLASMVSLFHYRGLRDELSVEGAESGAGGRANGAPAGTPREVASTPSSLDPAQAVGRVERAFWGKPAQVREALLAEGNRALASSDERVAELLFARAHELDGDRSQSAHGLARVRLAQGDLEGAEGWLLTAIEGRPREPAYHALYADILERSGRTSEAQLERALARSLAHLSDRTRAQQK
jgi:hypothetical protein